MLPRLLALRDLLEKELRRYRVDEAQCETFLLEWREMTFFKNGRFKTPTDFLEMDQSPGSSTSSHSLKSAPLSTGETAALLVGATLPSSNIHCRLDSNVTVEAGTWFRV